MTNILNEIYRNYGSPVSNSLVYEVASQKMEKINDKDFQHNIRGTQQNLKKKGSLENTGYGKWTYIN